MQRRISTNSAPAGVVDDSYFDGKWWQARRGSERNSQSSATDVSGAAASSNVNTGVSTVVSTAPNVVGDAPPASAPVAAPSDRYSLPAAPPGEVLLRAPPRYSRASSESSETARSPAERVRFILTESEREGTDMDDVSLDGHALFCQMDVLCHFDEGGMGWKEAARWLKYEEKVESADRWSKPHVSTMSLHSIFEIRKNIAENRALVILDISSSHGCIHQVAETLTTRLVLEEKLPAALRKQLLDVLIQPHKHKHRKGRRNKGDRAGPEASGDEREEKTKEEKGSGSRTSKANSVDADNNDTNKSTTGESSGKETTEPESEEKEEKEELLKESNKERNVKLVIDAQSSEVAKKDVKEGRADVKFVTATKARNQSAQEVSSLHHTYPGGMKPDDLLPHKPNKRLMGKIPGGSEVANILVGSVDFLREPIMAFVRLENPAVLADLTEVALPTRFLFLLLSPPSSTSVWENQEVGRSMAALFTDRVFCEVAYKAKSRQDLVDGIDEYIDDLTVLPPSIWDPATRLKPPEQTITLAKIRRRLMDSARRTPVDEAFHFAESAGQDETLEKTGRLFGGLVADVKRRYPHYWSDIKDGFHMQCLASIIFLYFACMTPIITFGGMLGAATDGQIGTMEAILAGAVCGIVYAMFAGQPLTIVGATGPLLVFEAILYLVCKENDFDFLSFRFWVGAWVTLFLLLIVAFDLSALVRYITRFTEESFSVLISLIFIFEAFKKVGGIWYTNPIHVHAASEAPQFKCHCVHPPLGVNNSDVSLQVPSHIDMLVSSPDELVENATYEHIRGHRLFETYNWSTLVYEDCITFQHRIVVDARCISEEDCVEHGWLLSGPACGVHTVTHAVPDVFFLCCFLFIGTFVIAIFFRNLRNSNFFNTIVRSTISDFAVLLAIVICSFVDYAMQLDTPKLMVPVEFKNTVDTRGWLVNPLNVTAWWLILAASVPAFLATILIFLDQQITAVIVNRKEHKLKKGHGYHLDLFVLSFLILFCSFFGLPWFVAATVRAITHVRSVIRESELRAPGERPQFLGVREQRVTGVGIHVLIGVSVLLTGLLRHVPMAVLYGVFLYMGITSLQGVQFVQRITLLFMPQKNQPDYPYLRHVATWRVHVFTVVQIIAMVIMWVLKSIKKISITFPLMLLVLCFLRKAMDYWFSQRELYWLDHILPGQKDRQKDDEAMEDAASYEIANADGGDKDSEMLPLEDEWDNITAQRDNLLGRKVRPRRLSEDVIKRYHNVYKPSIAAEVVPEETEDEEDAAKVTKFDESFRERKFSL